MARLKKNNGQILEQVDLGQLPHSSFIQNYNVRGTGNLGKLIPIRAYSTLPGDRISSDTAMSVQFQPLAVPMLDNMFVKYENFKIPYRTVWQGWEEFWTKGEDLQSSLTPPTISIADIASLFDYLGFPSNFLTPSRTTFGTDGLFLGFLQPATQTETGAIVQNSIIKPLYFKDKSAVNGYSDVNNHAYGVVNFDYIDLSVFTTVNFEAIRTNVENIAIQYGVVDLLDDFFKAFDAFVEFVRGQHMALFRGPSSDMSPAATGSIIPLGKYEDYILTMSVGGEPFVNAFRLEYPIVGEINQMEGSWDDMPVDFTANGNKHVSEIAKYYQKIFGIVYDMDNVSSTEEEQSRKDLMYANFPLINEKFLEYVRLVYDMIKPFIGLGSNWDMLGYGAVKEVDLLAAMVSSMVRQEPFSFHSHMLSRPLSYNALDLRCLYSVWYWYYRDVLLEKDAPEPRTTHEIEEDELFYLLLQRHRCWEKDTFTTALANTGNGSVVVPLQEGVVRPDQTEYVSQVEIPNESEVHLQGMDVVSYQLTDGTRLEFPSRFLLGKHKVDRAQGNDVLDSAFSLDTLDRARTLQKWLSKALIYGNRPEDALYTRWRVKYADARLQLPEFISQNSALVRMDVLVNNTTTAESNAGDKASNMYVNTNGAGFNEYFYEHGLLLTLATVMPENDYGYGRRRDVSRLDAFDYPDPDFSRLGFDAIYSDELVTGALASEADINDKLSMPLSVFGYQRRYYDYVTKHSEIHGELLDSMDYYTFARKFSVYDPTKYPLLNYRFVHCHPRTDMFVFDDPRIPLMWFDVHHSQKVTRALPLVSQVY